MRRSQVVALFRAVPLAAAAGLAGCISLLPKTPPVQLYQFGDTAAPAASPAGAPEASPVGVALGTVLFPQAATSDRILTVTGNGVAYIKDARWAAPASVLFQEDATRVFARQARNVRLLQRSELGAARAVLRLDVHEFEVRYEGGAPVVVISVDASLSRGGDVLAERQFDVRQPAAENRVSAIVAAFDQAAAQALQQIVAWTDALAPSIPPREAPTAAPLVNTTTTRSTTTTTVRPPG